MVYSLVIAIVALFCIQARSPRTPGPRLAGSPALLAPRGEQVSQGAA